MTNILNKHQGREEFILLFKAMISGISDIAANRANSFHYELNLSEDQVEKAMEYFNKEYKLN